MSGPAGPGFDPYRDGPRYPQLPPTGAYVTAPVAVVPSAPLRPGTLVIAAVLSFVLGGLLTIAAIVLFVVLAAVAATQDGAFVLDYHPAGYVSAAIVDLLSAVLLVGGAIGVLLGRSAGRLVHAVGALLVVASSVGWLVERRADGPRSILGALIFLVPTVIAVLLLWSEDSGRWLSAGSRSVREG